MTTRPLLSLILAAPLLAAPAAMAKPGALPPSLTKRIVGYYASWDRHLKVAQIPADRLTHVTYAFAAINGRHELVLANPATDAANMAAFAQLKKRFPRLKVLLAVGGAGSGSKPFSAMAATPASRQAFAASCAKMLFERHPAALDGLTIDWEYPQGDGHGVTGTVNDGRNLTALLQTLRATLNAHPRRGPRPVLLATTLPAGSTLLKRYDLRALAAPVDFIDVMTFDYATGTRLTGHNAPLFTPKPDQESVDRSVRTVLQAGVAPAKVNLGLAFFGRSWRNVAATAGAGQPGQSDSLDATYRNIARIGPADRYQRHWDAKAQVPFLTGSPEKRWISYDNPPSLSAKGRYAQKNQLGGVFIWHLGADEAAHTLLKATRNSLQRGMMPH
jgi:chitinase